MSLLYNIIYYIIFFQVSQCSSENYSVTKILSSEACSSLYEQIVAINWQPSLPVSKRNSSHKRLIIPIYFNWEIWQLVIVTNRSLGVFCSSIDKVRLYVDTQTCNFQVVYSVTNDWNSTCYLSVHGILGILLTDDC